MEQIQFSINDYSANIIKYNVFMFHVSINGQTDLITLTPLAQYSNYFAEHGFEREVDTSVKTKRR